MAELKKVRNIRPGFNKGLWWGLINAAWETVTGGASPWTLRNHADWSSLKKLDQYEAPKKDYVERTLPPRDRLASVYFAATEHDEDQPVHLKVLDTTICIDRCTTEYGNPCQRFCLRGCMRSSRMRAESGYRSTRRTACIARRAISRIRMRLLRG